MDKHFHSTLNSHFKRKFDFLWHYGFLIAVADTHTHQRRALSRAWAKAWHCEKWHPLLGWQWRPLHSWLLRRAALPTWRTNRSGNTGNYGNPHTGQKTHSGDHGAVHTRCNRGSVSIVEECVSRSCSSTCQGRGKYHLTVYRLLAELVNTIKAQTGIQEHKTNQLPPPLTQYIPSKKHSADTWVSFHKQRSIPGYISQHEVLSEEMDGLPSGGPLGLLLCWLKRSFHHHQIADLSSDGEHQNSVQNDRQMATDWLHLTPYSTHEPCHVFSFKSSAVWDTTCSTCFLPEKILVPSNLITKTDKWPIERHFKIL